MRRTTTLPAHDVHHDRTKLLAPKSHLRPPIVSGLTYNIIISKNNQKACIEIKDGLKPKSAQKLTPGETKFKDEWQGLYYIVRSTDDADSVMKEFVMIDEYGNKLNLVEVK